MNKLIDFRPDIAESWDYSKNTDTPNDVSVASSKKRWWICTKCKHTWIAAISNRTNGNSGCPGCCGRALTETNRFSTLYPELCLEWSSKNSKSPSEYTKTSNYKAIWNCKDCCTEW